MSNYNVIVSGHVAQKLLVYVSFISNVSLSAAQTI